MDGTEHIAVENPYGRWLNIDGYDDVKVADKSWGLIWDKSIYRVTIDSVNPLTFIDRESVMYRFGWQYLSDRGSIPCPFQGLPGLSPDRWLPAYYGHDFLCGAGGCYCSFDHGKTWRFVKMDREQCDRLLVRMIGAMNGGYTARHVIWLGVRVGARFQDHPGGFWTLTESGGLSEHTSYEIPAMEGTEDEHRRDNVGAVMLGSRA